MDKSWKIDVKGLELFRFDCDGNCYRMPHEKNGRIYGLRLIKMQYPSRWILNGKPYSKRQLKGKLIKVDEPIILNKEEGMPF
jgi:hypothetical protein